MADFYWIGGTSTWNATAGSKWSSTSGGSPNGAVPTNNDDVYFDAGISGNYTVTIGANAVCRNLSISKPASGTVTIAGTTDLPIYGNIVFPNGVTNITQTYSAYLTPSATSGTQTITTNGGVITMKINQNGAGGIFQFADNFTTGSGTELSLTAGTMDFNGKTIDIGVFSSSGTGVRTVKFSGGTVLWQPPGSTNYWDMSTSTNATIDYSGGGTIKVVAGGNRTFKGGGLSYPTLWWAPTAATRSLIIQGSNTFAELKCIDTTQDPVLEFTAGTTQTIASWNITGGAGHLITINSNNTSTHALTYSGAGDVSADYLNIQHSVAGPANTWYAGANSTNNQATATAGSGWIFTVPPATTDIKSFNGLAYASVKSVNGLAIASVKSVNGLA